MARKPVLKILLRVVPMSFALGAAVEYFMIYARIGNETFYDTAKRMELSRREDRQEKLEEFRDLVMKQLQEKEKEKEKGNAL